jgi:outer membrane protein assembly factor BamB
VTDGERLCVYLSYAGLYAVDFDGTVVWSKPMDVLPMRMGWGAAASSALHDGRLYIVSDNEAQSSLAAYDARTGNEVWRTRAKSGRHGRRRLSGRTAPGPRSSRPRASESARMTQMASRSGSWPG